VGSTELGRMDIDGWPSEFSLKWECCCCGVTTRPPDGCLRRYPAHQRRGDGVAVKESIRPRVPRSRAVRRRVTWGPLPFCTSIGFQRQPARPPISNRPLADISIVVSLDGPVDVLSTLSALRSGPYDPVQVNGPDRVCRAVWFGSTAALVQWRQVDGSTVEVSIETARSGAEVPNLEQFALDTLGASDDPNEFRPDDKVLSRLARRNAGMRFGRHRSVSDIVVPAILGQRVTAEEAHRAWRRIVMEHGERAPGASELMMPPRPQVLAALPYYTFHPYGVDRNRAETIRRVSRELARRDDHTVLDRLATMRGVGPWTMATLRQRVLGDADAPIIGDFHIPNTVTWHLAGEARGTDQRMLELLDRFAGQRARAQRLVMQMGKAPKYGAKRRISSIADR
jgi:3-methyladenine DNA glycosylase/8-oxoguanine DNA glycosylase